MTAPKSPDATKALRDEFVRLLTIDGGTRDRRRRDFNQAIFMPPASGPGAGHAVWTDTTLDMVLEKFDKAAGNVMNRIDALEEEK